jgi:hypothetical protein
MLRKDYTNGIYGICKERESTTYVPYLPEISKINKK